MICSVITRRFKSCWVSSPWGSGLNDKAKKAAPLLCLINHAVGLVSPHEPVAAKQGAGNCGSLFAGAVLDIADRGFGAPLCFW